MMDTRYAYLVHLLGWGLPVLALQLAALASHYRARTGRVLRAVLPPALAVGTYLSAADHVAIRRGIWVFGDARHVGVYVGAVPLEEVLFFFVTSLLVALGIALFTALLEVRQAPSRGGAR
ncbi:lycopene cyclase domain-containing protein [Aggregicoccus sp. 17bor-14]|uniref:lycopene cyclase domain-containing protein n=1 Tax=Myxococcaceae TaxID=31 RepID=UPI00129C2AED|nr:MULTISPECIES: lycopene cyclase domain-containing protein [Myxococcaceae]MBF5042983.1 lycopene cyclase domain-containing protein [Simulacricoccus sp. 17bor-14]MRI88749.1 lycopene cyclase domain-containing protein [Aggregicoccus sp. 17bor-14]